MSAISATSHFHWAKVNFFSLIFSVAHVVKEIIWNYWMFLLLRSTIFNFLISSIEKEKKKLATSNWFWRQKLKNLVWIQHIYNIVSIFKPSAISVENSDCPTNAFLVNKSLVKFMSLIHSTLDIVCHNFPKSFFVQKYGWLSSVCKALSAYLTLNHISNCWIVTDVSIIAATVHPHWYEAPTGLNLGQIKLISLSRILHNRSALKRWD